MNFQEYEKVMVLHYDKILKRDLEWLIGFVEGDGSFIVSGEGDKCRHFFIINQKSVKVLYKVRKILGFGKVSNYGSYFRYIVADRVGVKRLLYLFNGNLILNKTNIRFQYWLESFNYRYKELLIFKGRFQPKSFMYNGWLSGFIEAEGCFYAVLRNIRFKSLRLSCFLDQKEERDTLILISEEFSGYCIKRKEIEAMFRVSLESKVAQGKLISYLNKYKLKGDKRISFLRWRRLVQMDLTLISKDRLKNLVRNINKR